MGPSDRLISFQDPMGGHIAVRAAFSWQGDNLTALDVSRLQRNQAVLLVDDAAYPDIFVARVKPEPGQAAPQGGVEAGGGEYFVGFSRVCTHMGCYLLTPAAGHSRSATAQVELGTEPIVRCPCHHSAFDLVADGRVVVGQSPCRLPQLRLEMDAGKVAICGWQYENPSYPARHGVPYGHASGTEA